MGVVTEVVTGSTELGHGWPLALHGRDPRTGLTGTWHIERDETTGQCRVEWAFGDQRSETGWRRARKVTTLLNDTAVRALVVRITGVRITGA